MQGLVIYHHTFIVDSKRLRGDTYKIFTKTLLEIYLIALADSCIIEQ